MPTFELLNYIPRGWNFISDNIFFSPVVIAFALLMTVFLFWRACRHELFDSTEAFDLAVVASLGAVSFARVFDFAFRNEDGIWTLSRLLFFNRYGSFDFWGGLIGMYVALYFLTRDKKISVWSILDLFAAPLAFGQAFIKLAKGESYAFFAILFIFIVLKRLAAKKRHSGFFASFYVVFVSAVTLVIQAFEAPFSLAGGFDYERVAPFAFLISGMIVWYLLSRRKVVADLKKFLGILLLSVFRVKRMIVSANEAGTFSKTIIFLPYYLLRTIFVIFVTIGKEIKVSFLELLYVFGLRKFSR